MSQEELDLFDFAARGILKTKVEKKYPVGEVKKAVERASQGGRDGKVLFAFGA